MHYADYKTILSPQNGMNLYRGCTHGCIYCDSRSKCYQFDHDFEDIEIKRDAAQILEQQLRKKRQPCMIGTGSMCDPYIPLETELQITRQSIEVIERYGFGLAILTKSTRLLRDLDLLKRINERTKCVVQTTLTTFDEGLCRKIEPHVSSTRERFEMLLRLKEEGIPTVVWLCPILPFINDTEENILGILRYCAEAKVKGVICFGMGVTLREGNREYFFAQLDRLFPGMKEQYIRTFGLSYENTSPRNAELMRLYHAFCEEHGMMHDNAEIFTYLRTFTDKSDETQLSLF